MMVTCQNCGATVEYFAWRQPVSYLTRDADAFSPRSFLIVAGGWLIHRCELDATNSRVTNAPGG